MNYLLETLQSYPNWIVWNPSEINAETNKQTKIPYSVVSNGKLRASVSDSLTWTTLQVAQAFINANSQFQLGFVLTDDCKLTCIDFDCYRANGDSSIIKEHHQIHDWFNSYSELSPSDKGVHSWVHGSIPSGRRWNEKHIEVYSSGHYMTVTKNAINNVPVADCQQQLDSLIAQFPSDKSTVPTIIESQPESKTDKELCTMAAFASNGELFQSLYLGNWQGRYPSQSEADQSLMNLIAFYSDSPIQCDRVFHASELGKRSKAKRKDYIQGLIRKAWDQKQPSLPGATAIEAQVKQAVEVAQQSLELWPKPMSKDAFIGYVREFVELVEPTTESDPHALLFTLLQTFGCDVSKNPYFETDGKKQRTNLLGSLAGPTNAGRKGTALSNVKKLYELINPEFVNKNFCTGMTSGEGITSKIRDTSDSDKGVDDKRLFVVETEFAKPLNNMKREGSNLGGTIRQIFDCDKIGSMARGNQDSCLEPRVAIHAHSTVEELKGMLAEMDKVNGFGNRFLFVCTRRSKELPHGGNVHFPALFALAERIKSVVIRAQTQVLEMKWSPEAYVLWETVYSDLTSDDDGKLVSRGAPIVVRLAMIYALMDPITYTYGVVHGDCHKVLIEHLKAALEVWRYCKDSAIHIFGDARYAALANSILDKLKSAGPIGMTQTQISLSFSRNKSASELQRALLLLKGKGIIKSTEEPTNGRPVTKWSV